MSHIRIPHSLATHPTVLDLAGELGPQAEALALGVTIRLLLWADQHGPGDGELPSLAPRALAMAAGLPEAEDLPLVLRRTRTIDDHGCLTLWALTAGPVAKAREDGRVRAAASRALAPAKDTPLAPHFEAWWKNFTAPGPWGATWCTRYKGRGSKAAARKVWEKMGLEADEPTRAALFAGMHRQRAEICHLAKAGEFVPRWQDGERYLGRRRWEDEPLCQVIPPPLPPEYELPETNVDPYLEGLPA